MAKNVDVLVEDISTDEYGRPTELTGTRRTLTYKSFLYLNANPDDKRYKLIGEIKSIDAKGNITLAEGNPNLNPQHRTQIQVRKSAEPVVDAGQPSIQEVSSDPPIVERKKPGPKRKQITETEITA
jgi:hypothetical protein